MSKSNQLTHVLQLHLGKSMNLARIRFLSLMIFALYKVQSVSFEKLATAFDSKAKGNPPYVGSNGSSLNTLCLAM